MPSRIGSMLLQNPSLEQAADLITRPQSRPIRAFTLRAFRHIGFWGPHPVRHCTLTLSHPLTCQSWFYRAASATSTVREVVVNSVCGHNIFAILKPLSTMKVSDTGFFCFMESEFSQIEPPLPRATISTGISVLSTTVKYIRSCSPPSPSGLHFSTLGSLLAG